MPQDQELQHIYCAWANEKWPQEDNPVIEVKFEYEYEGPWSEITPGVGEMLHVAVKRAKEGRFYYETTIYDMEVGMIDLINEIAKFSYNYVD